MPLATALQALKKTIETGNGLPAIVPNANSGTSEGFRLVCANLKVYVGPFPNSAPGQRLR